MNPARIALLPAMSLALTAAVSAASIFNADNAKKEKRPFSGKVLHFAVIQPGALAAGGAGGGLLLSRVSLGPVLTTVQQVRGDELANARFSVGRPEDQLQKLPMAPADAEKAAVQPRATPAQPVAFPVAPAKAQP